MQTVRGFDTPHESVIEVRGLDVLDILESYYRQSEQTSARFFEYDDNEFLMLMALPEVDEAWLQDLTREQAHALLEEEATHEAEQRMVRFGCACDEERILSVATQVFARRPEELFGGGESAEILCPRCGQAYEIRRDAFDAALEKTQDEGEAGEAKPED